MKHSPGPWQIGLATRHKSVAIFDGESVADAGVVVNAVCLISPIESVCEKDEANAKLIAAAPELLEALQAMLSRFEHADQGMIKADHVKGLARKAIEKATT